MTEILIVRTQNNHLGDTICSLPMYKALKNKYPDSGITIAIFPTHHTIDLKKLNPYINRVLIFRKDKIGVLINSIKELRKKKYDIVIVASTVRVSFTSYIITLLSKGKIKVGAKRIDNEKNKIHFILDVKEEFDWGKNNTKHVLRFLDIVKGLGCELPYDEIKKMRINLSKEEAEFGSDFISKHFPDRKKLIFGFHPGGGQKGNIWNTENYFELIKLISQKYNSYIFLTSGFADKEITDKLESELTASGIEYITSKDMEPFKLASILKHVNLQISNNTGVMHLAAYTGTNTLSVFRKGMTANEWSPLFNNCKYTETKSENINDITVTEMFEKVKEFFP
jgi:ADP-heptose:LPS heptosyltransferase